MMVGGRACCPARGVALRLRRGLAAPGGSLPPSPPQRPGTRHFSRISPYAGPTIIVPRHQGAVLPLARCSMKVTREHAPEHHQKRIPAAIPDAGHASFPRGGSCAKAFSIRARCSVPLAPRAISSRHPPGLDPQAWRNLSGNPLAISRRVLALDGGNGSQENESQ